MNTQPSDNSSGESYTPNPAVEALTPTQPETLSPSMLPTSDPNQPPPPAPDPMSPAEPATPAPVPSTSDSSTAAPPQSAPVMRSALFPGDMVLNDPKLIDLASPYSPTAPPRPTSQDLFQPESNIPADAQLLKRFVTDQRLRDLWNQIDAIQEDVIQSVRADRISTDTYQQDLLLASSLLLQSPQNYDEAREIVYRVRGDLNRERRVLADIDRYRPPLLIYHVIWLIIALMASALDPQFRRLMPDTLPILKLAFPPIIFGVLGALFNGYMALHEHSTIRRDFDPIHISWYIINPFIGALMGLIVFIFFVVTGTSFTPNLVNDQSMASAPTPFIIWLLGFIVGWQQTVLFNLLNGFLKTVNPSGNPPTQETAQVQRPSTTITTPSINDVTVKPTGTTPDQK